MKAAATRLPPRLRDVLTLLQRSFQSISHVGQQTHQPFCVCDVGADHGKLSLAATEIPGCVVQVHAVERSEKAYNKHLSDLPHFNPDVAVYLGNGLKPLIAENIKVDIIVACGFGALAISRVLHPEDVMAVGATRLVVQPWPSDLIRVTQLTRYLELTLGYVHIDQAISSHGKHFSVTSSFSLTEHLSSAQSATQEEKMGLAGSFSRWPLYQRLVKNEHVCEAALREAALFRAYLERHQCPLEIKVDHMVHASRDMDQELGDFWRLRSLVRQGVLR